MLDPRTASIEELQRALGGPQPAVPVRLAPDVFGKIFCEALIGLHETTPTRESGFMWGSEEIIRADAKHRVDCVLAEGTVRVVEDALARAGIVGNFERHLVARYDAPTGHFAEHRDNVFPGTQHRRIAISINLNADYEGGQLSLPECGVTVSAPPGCAVLFGASTLHSVSPVTRGRRFVYLTFL